MTVNRKCSLNNDLIYYETTGTKAAWPLVKKPKHWLGHTLQQPSVCTN